MKSLSGSKINCDRMMTELTKVFEHATVDPKWYAYWEDIGAFRADPESARKPFSMVLPPPNVTGCVAHRTCSESDLAGYCG